MTKMVSAKAESFFKCLENKEIISVIVKSEYETEGYSSVPVKRIKAVNFMVNGENELCYKNFAGKSSYVVSYSTKNRANIKLETTNRTAATNCRKVNVDDLVEKLSPNGIRYEQVAMLTVTNYGVYKSITSCDAVLQAATALTVMRHKIKNAEIIRNITSQLLKEFNNTGPIEDLVYKLDDIVKQNKNTLFFIHMQYFSKRKLKLFKEISQNVNVLLISDNIDTGNLPQYLRLMEQKPNNDDLFSFDNNNYNFYILRSYTDIISEIIGKEYINIHEVLRLLCYARDSKEVGCGVNSTIDYLSGIYHEELNKTKIDLSKLDIFKVFTGYSFAAGATDTTIKLLELIRYIMNTECNTIGALVLDSNKADILKSTYVTPNTYAAFFRALIKVWKYKYLIVENWRETQYSNYESNHVYPYGYKSIIPKKEDIINIASFSVCSLEKFPTDTEYKVIMEFLNEHVSYRVETKNLKNVKLNVSFNDMISDLKKLDDSSYL